MSVSFIGPPLLACHLEIILRELDNIRADKGKQEAAAGMGIKQSDVFHNRNGELRLKSLDSQLKVLTPRLQDPRLAKLIGKDALSSLQVIIKNYDVYKKIRDELDPVDRF